MSRKKVFAISGSTRAQSANLHIIKWIAGHAENELDVEIYDQISELPHFNPDLDKEKAPDIIEAFRKKIEEADGILICTPEYVFSLPGSFKNAIEWTVSTIIFTDKPTALITASASGRKAHESLQLVMKTVGARFTEATTLLIEGAKGKVSTEGQIVDEHTHQKLQDLTQAFIEILKSH